MYIPAWLVVLVALMYFPPLAPARDWLLERLVALVVAALENVLEISAFLAALGCIAYLGVVA